ncbi:MAG: DUF1800 family protein [Bradymonadia bacterium]
MTSMTFEDSAHLLGRIAFGGDGASLEHARARGRAATIDTLLTAPTALTPHPPLDWVHEKPPLRRRRLLDDAERKAFRKLRRQRGRALQSWWLEAMATSEHPAFERMLVFWHGHFTSSLRKVKWPGWIWQQHLTMRRHALGSFRDLLRAMVRDPAMLIYLDNTANRRRAPNENLARELMELFTLGEGHYTEADVKTAARCLTGWGVDRTEGFSIKQRAHDGRTKTLFGRTGPLDGDDLVDVLLEHPRTAVHIAERMWIHFAGAPHRPTIEKMAQAFRRSDYQITAPLKVMLGADAFYAPTLRGAHIKSPIDLIVGTVRLLNLKPEDWSPLARACGRLGQGLFNPPNVKGWPGGTRWITTDTLMARHALLDHARDSLPEDASTAWRLLAQRLGVRGGPQRTYRQLHQLCLPVHDAPGKAPSSPWAALGEVLRHPAYQLV